MNGNLYEERGEDRRIRKSKKALQEALIRLLSKKSIGEITIKELTDEADVHRGTFYHHYADAMDLKVQTEREIAEQLTEILSSVPQSRLEQGPYPLLVRVLEYLEDNRRDCQDAGKRARRTVADGRAVCRHQRAVFGSAAVWRAAQVRQPVLCSGTAGDADQLGGGRNEDGARRDGTHHGADDGQPKPDSDEPIRFHTIE